MNIDNLKIVVIPTETDNYITQYSSVEVILSCEEKIIYSISEYLIAQNNDTLPIHFSFLIDMKNRINLTYECVEKESKIKTIKGIIEEWGTTYCRLPKVAIRSTNFQFKINDDTRN